MWVSGNEADKDTQFYYFYVSLYDIKETANEHLM